MPRLTTIAVCTLAAITLPLAGTLALARAEHWRFNNTTCMPLGFYAQAPAPRHLHDGDIVEICPSVQNPLHLSFVGFPAFQRTVSAGQNPAMEQAIKGFWLEHESGSPCASGLMPFAKRVAATPGQTVRITAKGVMVNGKLLPHSRLISTVSGIPVIHLPIGFTMTIPKGYFWDYAPGTAAYTSAYYGPEPITHILHGLRPVWTVPGSQTWYTDKLHYVSGKGDTA